MDQELNDTTQKTSDDSADTLSVQVKNPRISKVKALEEEVSRQRQIEEDRAKRIKIELEYLNNILKEVNDNLEYSMEEKKANNAFEDRIRTEVFQMHGISNDKVQGMEERNNALYQGAAFVLLFLSGIMVVLCGILHGFGSNICMFMSFYTALQAALLTNRRLKLKLIETITHIVYLLLFPAMLVLFVCFELGYPQYDALMPAFIAAGLVILVFGVSSYFLYDPYKKDRRSMKKAEKYIADMEKTALKDVQMREAKFKKQEKKKAREDAWDKKKTDIRSSLDDKTANMNSKVNKIHEQINNRKNTSESSTEITAEIPNTDESSLIDVQEPLQNNDETV